MWAKAPKSVTRDKHMPCLISRLSVRAYGLDPKNSVLEPYFRATVKAVLSTVTER
jgi:hypothetical protein